MHFSLFKVIQLAFMIWNTSSRALLWILLPGETMIKSWCIMWTPFMFWNCGINALFSSPEAGFAPIVSLSSMKHRHIAWFLCQFQLMKGRAKIQIWKIVVSCELGPYLLRSRNGQVVRLYGFIWLSHIQSDSNAIFLWCNYRICYPGCWPWVWLDDLLLFHPFDLLIKSFFQLERDLTCWLSYRLNIFTSCFLIYLYQ